MRVYITSLGRPGNVPAMEAQAGIAQLVWLVPEEQADDYARAGATSIITGPPGKPDKINAILDAYPDQWNVFSDDDCRKLTLLNETGDRVKCTLGLAAAEYIAVGNRRRDHGVFMPNMSNAHFAARRVSAWGSTVGWFMAVAPNTECRLDPALLMNHDVDFACQVFMRYGRIARVGYIIGDYRYADKTSHFREQHDDRSYEHKVVIDRYPGLVLGSDGDTMKFARIKA